MTLANYKLVTFLLQRQLSSMKDESEIMSGQIQKHKRVVTQKEAEIEQLSKQLQQQETLLQNLLQHPFRLQEVPGMEAEMRDEEVISNEVLDLQLYIFQLEEEKEEAKRQLVASQLQIKLLHERVNELIGIRQSEWKVSCINIKLLLDN